MKKGAPNAASACRGTLPPLASLQPPNNLPETTLQLAKTLGEISTNYPDTC